MTNPISPDHNSQQLSEEEEEEETWSEITTPSPPLSDTDDNSWILIPNLFLQPNDDNNDESEEEEEEEDASEEEEEEEEELLQQQSSSSSSTTHQRVTALTGFYSSSSSSSENFFSILIRERVLRRLPAEQLLNLRTVSHQWNDYITSPFFIHSHSQSSLSISGVYYTHHSSQTHTQFLCPAVRSPELKFLPEPVVVLSSSRGLLCCKAVSCDVTTTKYFIVNPLTGSWVLLPSPAKYHGLVPAAVIVFDEPFVFNFSLDYKLVVPFYLGGCYGFEVFRSREWEWSVSTELCVAEMIEPESGVAAGGCAHWRTSMQTVVSYDPEVERSWDVVWPASYREDVDWELAEFGGKLSCVCVDGDEVCVYEIQDGSQGSEGSGWKEVRRMRRIAGSGEVRVVRVQEVREVVWVENGRVWRWSLEDGKWGEGNWYVGEGSKSFVSFVGSLLHAFGSWG